MTNVSINRYYDLILKNNGINNTISATFPPMCKHKNIIIRNLPFWIFTKKFVFCLDCKEFLDLKDFEN